MREHISYLERINQLFPPKEQMQEKPDVVDMEVSADVGTGGTGGTIAPEQAGSGPAHTEPVEQLWNSCGTVAPSTPAADVLGDLGQPAVDVDAATRWPALLPAALEDSWRALVNGEDAPDAPDDLAETCHRCCPPTDCYDEDGVAWCFVCWDGRLDESTPWHDLLACLGVLAPSMLARRAARAYHEAGRPRVRLQLYGGASPEWQQGHALWRRIGWALSGDPGHLPRVLALLRQLAEDGGRAPSR